MRKSALAPAQCGKYVMSARELRWYVPLAALRNLNKMQCTPREYFLRRPYISNQIKHCTPENGVMQISI